MKDYAKISKGKEKEKISEPELRALELEKVLDVLPEKETTEPKFAIVIAKSKLNVRKLPWMGMQSEMVCQLNRGDKIQVDKLEEGWAHIVTSAGIEGYVMTEYIQEV
jgi:hypothetical protein